MAAGEMQSLVHMIEILDSFTVERPQLGVRELARMVGMPASTVGRFLVSLNSLGLLSQDPETKLYRMGPKVMGYSMVYTASLDLRGIAKPMLEELFRLTNETVSLYILAGDLRICAFCIESSERLRVVLREGEHLPLHAGSAGKALLAFMPKEEIDRIVDRPLEKMTSATITSREALLSELEKVRQLGYAVSHSERFEDVIGLAAPVFDRGGNVVAAINIAGPSQRFTDAIVQKILPKQIELADRISSLLGYSGTKRKTPTASV